MKDQVTDAKLKNLIQVCKETGNFKKLAEVSFTLTSNRVNEMGIYLGIRPRNRNLGEKLFEYMEIINDIFQRNLRVPIFPQALIDEIRDFEVPFLKNRGNLPYDYIKNIFRLYYEIRKMDIINLHKTLDGDEVLGNSTMGVFSFLSPRTRRKERDSSKLRPLILQKIREKERTVQRQLNRSLNSHQFETAIHLKSIKKSLTKDKRGKITVYGALKDNITYQQSIESIFGYFILGLIILMTSLGIVILAELSITPVFSNDLSSWILIFFGSAALLIYFYIKQFRRERG